jgi:hypothetical protein
MRSKLALWHCLDNLAMAADRAVGCEMFPISYRGRRFPPTVIQHAVWLYLRFHPELSRCGRSEAVTVVWE